MASLVDAMAMEGFPKPLLLKPIKKPPGMGLIFRGSGLTMSVQGQEFCDVDEMRVSLTVDLGVDNAGRSVLC